MEKQYIFRENGTIRIGKIEEIQDFKEHWTYIQEDSSGSVVLVDNDATRVAPIAKAILDQFELFPELTWIKKVFLTLLIIGGLMVTLELYQIFTFPSKDFIKENNAILGKKEQTQNQIGGAQPTIIPDLPRAQIPQAK